MKYLETTTMIGEFQKQRAELIHSYLHKRNLLVELKDPTPSQWIQLWNEKELTLAEIGELECQHIEKSVVPHLKPHILAYERKLRTALEDRHTRNCHLIATERGLGATHDTLYHLAKKNRLQGLTELLATPLPTANKIQLNPTPNWLPPIIGYDRMKKYGLEQFISLNSWCIYQVIK